MKVLSGALTLLLVACACQAEEPGGVTGEVGRGVAGEVGRGVADEVGRGGPDGVPGGFWKHWGDGQAELSGYRLIQPRYGQPRLGQAVLIFVTETFSERDRVKADPGKHPASDEFPVMKLNLKKDSTLR